MLFSYVTFAVLTEYFIIWGENTFRESTESQCIAGGSDICFYYMFYICRECSVRQCGVYMTVTYVNTLFGLVVGRLFGYFWWWMRIMGNLFIIMHYGGINTISLVWFMHAGQTNEIVVYIKCLGLIEQKRWRFVNTYDVVWLYLSIYTLSANA